MAAADDRAWMRRAIGLAQANLGKTGDNPSVGCVLVKDGVVVGEGATAAGGRPHAEEIALDAAGPAAAGAATYVTLEPCGERSSGAASCGERLARAGVARVVVACDDPSALAAGRGLQRLAAAGIPVDLGVAADEAAALYAAYRPRPSA
ncbi:MAG TPA: bifunctional diaminohydroxyphosphoribosylaminopyrimidine deaminase/5-amino-6-(5-phosphoribosylamino)uracil reductase RibD [Phenylobacterium sp.]|jgi:pyrimidine deaminase RibD-like protein|uniref:bifunctional diaminohydroxyphosphoribosylaminopyrimidine deaminase/5-amino-6-(5-phosphoribosylamino)uracil reductase RibD n=1 Tax=Phenylobacterium sp. TaxID=1871053 RepID=UPI002C5B34C7|nr:bifunctional diaminohydroxyphosphoribosylaminopyrimidine deaminase/5-amino-6-(5-phosphoribosylamino)uracil reductase RibD [Phenylobacterium sp.]HXA40813.1 bifunctional diaminohydroxyphosphoribosylaminopyrimidine deaminase/5-amino-6-(5-phosphoribosylamino)uracil reductase RibD [Phenylobacterium sp.]